MDVNKFFKSTFQDNYWGELAVNYPRYYVNQTKDNDTAEWYVFNRMKETYPELDLDPYEKELRRLIDIKLMNNF